MQYLHLPGFSTPVLAQLRFLDKEQLDFPYFDLKKVLEVYKALKYLKLRDKQDETILAGQPTVKNEVKKFNEAKDKYGIKEYPKDLENKEESVKIYVKSFESNMENEKAEFRNALSNFYEELFEKKNSIFVGIVDFREKNLSEGKNAVFYENVFEKNGQFDLEKATKKPIDWPAKIGMRTEDVTKLLENNSYYFFADRERVIKENDGLALVRCSFGMVTTVSIDSISPLSAKRDKIGAITSLPMSEITV